MTPKVVVFSQGNGSTIFVVLYLGFKSTYPNPLLESVEYCYSLSTSSFPPTNSTLHIFYDLVQKKSCHNVCRKEPMNSQVNYDSLSSHENSHFSIHGCNMKFFFLTQCWKIIKKVSF